jgi:hypothetical protein
MIAYPIEILFLLFCCSKNHFFPSNLYLEWFLYNLITRLIVIWLLFMSLYYLNVNSCFAWQRNQRTALTTTF